MVFISADVSIHIVYALYRALHHIAICRSTIMILTFKFHLSLKLILHPFKMLLIKD